jgi:hypothetical protein
MFEGGAADETADATEAVDSDFNSHDEELEMLKSKWRVVALVWVWFAMQ